MDLFHGTSVDGTDGGAIFLADPTMFGFAPREPSIILMNNGDGSFRFDEGRFPTDRNLTWGAAAADFDGTSTVLSLLLC